jgi:hypothetical protein
MQNSRSRPVRPSEGLVIHIFSMSTFRRRLAAVDEPARSASSYLRCDVRPRFTGAIGSDID